MRAWGLIGLLACAMPAWSDALRFERMDRWSGSYLSAHHGLAVADLKGGPNAEIYFVAYGGPEHDAVRMFDLVESPFEIRSVFSTGYNRSIAFHDLDGDGRAELVAWDDVTQGIAAYTLSNDLWPTGLIGISLGANASPVIRNLDGVGGAEVLFKSHGTTSGTFNWPLLRWTTERGYERVDPVESLGYLPGDYDGDGRSESFRLAADGESWEVRRIGPDLSLSASLGQQTPLTDSVWARKVGDVDGDGRDDVVEWRRDGALVVWRGRSDARLESPVVVGHDLAFEPLMGQNGDPLHLVDLDGRPGLEIVTDGSASVRVLSYSGGAAVLVFDEPWTGLYEPGRRALAFGDVDGDGRTDLVRAVSGFTAGAGTTLELYLLRPASTFGGGGGGTLDAWALLVLAIALLACGAGRRKRA